MISTFVEDIEEEISSSSIVVSSGTHKYFGPSNKEVYIMGKLIFIDLSSLEFSLYAIEKGKELIYDKYRFQYMDSNNRPVFRYDNAPHLDILTGLNADDSRGVMQRLWMGSCFTE